MRTAVVKLGDIAAMPGRPLSAKFWTDRHDNEDYQAWRRRKDLEAQAETLLAQLKRAQKKTEQLLREIRKNQ